MTALPVEVRGATGPDHRRASFAGLTLARVLTQPFGLVMGTYLTLVVATRASTALAITFALTAHKYLSLLVFPVAGRLSDRTRSPRGRRVPYLVGGLAVSGAAVWALSFVGGYWPLVLAIVVAREAAVVQRIARFTVTPDVFGRSRWLRAVLTMGAVTMLPGAAVLAVIRFTWKQDDPSTWGLTYQLAAVGLVLAAIAVAALVREAPGSHEAAERAAAVSWRVELARVLQLPNAKVLLVAGGLLAAAGASTGRLFAVWANRQLGAGAADLVDLSIATGVLGIVAGLPGLWIAGRVHPRTLAVAAALLGGVATAAHFLVTDLWMVAVLATVAVPLTVAAVAAGIPQLLHLVPPGESLGESIGLVAGPLGVVTSLAAYSSALLVDAFDDYRLIWLVAGGLTLAAAVALGRLRVPPGEERTDLRKLLAQLRRSDRGRGGLFGGTVDDADVLAEPGDPDRRSV